MKDITINLKFCVQRYSFLDDDMAEKSYNTIKDAIVNHKPFRNDNQGTVTVPITDGEYTAVIAELVSVSISDSGNETFVRKMLEKERDLRAMKIEILGPDKEEVGD